MQPDVAKFLHDVRQGCDRLQKITANKSFTDYQADDVLQWAVERQFIVVGEALVQAGKLEPDLPPLIGAFASRFDGILTRNEGDFRQVFPSLAIAAP